MTWSPKRPSENAALNPREHEANAGWEQNHEVVNNDRASKQSADILKGINDTAPINHSGGELLKRQGILWEDNTANAATARMQRVCKRTVRDRKPSILLFHLEFNLSRLRLRLLIVPIHVLLILA